MPTLNDILLQSIRETQSYRRLVRELERAKPGRAVSMKGLRAGALAGLTAALAHVGSRSNVPANAERSARTTEEAGHLSKLASRTASHESGAVGRDSATHRPSLIVLVTANVERAAELADEVAFFGLPQVFHYPKSQLLPYEPDEPYLEEQVKHLEFFHHLASLGEKPRRPDITDHPASVCVTSIEALFARVAPLEMVRKHRIEIQWGQPFDTQAFAQWATELGYERVPTVEARGEFSIRGGIVDIFPLHTEHALRIDLFGLEIESIRWFDVHTQRSLRQLGELESVTILPARERVLIEAALATAPLSLHDSNAAEDHVSGDGTSDNQGGRTPSELPLVQLLDLLPPDALLVFDNAELYPLLDERFRQVRERQYREYSARSDHLPAPSILYADLQQVMSRASQFVQIHHTLLAETPATISIETHSFETMPPSFEKYLTEFRKRLAEEFRVAVVCDNLGQAERLKELLVENDVGVVIIPDPCVAPEEIEDAALRQTVRRVVEASPLERLPEVILTTGLLHNGFVMPEAGLYVVTDREIFGRYRRRPVYRKLYKGTPIPDVRQIQKGDYVVHLEHGIGRFEGIRTQQVDGKVCDFLELTYADDDKLLVPVEKIAFVHKYSAPEQGEIHLDKLGTKNWTRRRRKSQEAVEKLAKELLQLYARRAAAKGYAFGPDTAEQREFEAAFLYTETPDQLRAIEEVKRDMCEPKPMDRLICGDVGFGKTEVAIRAAFKAIQEGKQVALLCPTTILAQQHYNTFRERFADYPIRVEMLSRFKTPKETKEILAGLKSGIVNMVVGTHALLSKSVQFRDLGLVIVDEEQRFGVKQKERLKELRASVDFLTLTATPIPRTLYMALSGLRDMSLIATPPADRHPVKTRIIHFDAEQIEEAILRELNRGGQVFFVHNRVHNIHEVARRLQEIVPSARIAIAHGQMPDGELEQVMMDFIDGKYDVLVSTTIIENGLDIPNVNTIIINRADAFGLAQLYQLRGRVGRENRQAYAYLVVPQGQPITESAVARLAAIEEFVELGSGFNIAMRDLEIRGAGNLLGREQHGTMADVGFELYCKMLEEAVEALTGSLREEELETEIQWSTNAFLPASYIPVEGQRFMIYKQIAEATTLAQLDAITEELRDRYGEVEISRDDGTVVSTLPQPVVNLMSIAKLRILGRKLSIRKIAATRHGFEIHRPDAVNELGPTIRKLLRSEGPKVFVNNPNSLEFHYDDWAHRPQLEEAVAMLKQVLNEFTRAQPRSAGDEISAAVPV
ncbi:MAG: transcription-repair coupling factor [Candidatus Sumerlaea chitinivorans]|nr:transcription-repair coupling factor [Candidatus Sumerlaea chitinivorans]